MSAGRWKTRTRAEKRAIRRRKEQMEATYQRTVCLGQSARQLGQMFTSSAATLEFLKRSLREVRLVLTPSEEKN